MTATTLDRSTWADDQLDSQQPLQQLADAVATLWSAGTGLALQPAAVALDDTHARVVLAEPSPPAGGRSPRRPCPAAWTGRLAGVPATLPACWSPPPVRCLAARLPGCAPATTGSRGGWSLSCR
jgi:hypothetical protein